VTGAWRRRASARLGPRALGAAGALLAALAALAAAEAIELGGPLAAVEGRTGRIEALVAGALALAAAGAVLVERRAPAWATAVMGVAGSVGAFAVGALWLAPGIVLVGAAVWGLALLPDPFAGPPRAGGP
jgi:hypothetical protein